MDRLFALITAAVLAGGCAPATLRDPSSVSGAASDPLERWPADELPNGVMASCKVVNDEHRADGGTADVQTTMIEASDGAFGIMLPRAEDWQLQCDPQHLLWAFSKSQRMQLTVNPHQLDPQESSEPELYLTLLAHKVIQGLQSHGVVASDVELTKLPDPEAYLMEMELSAPAGEQWPLFPQHSIFTTRAGPGDTMLDAHLTTYHRDPDERRSLRSTAQFVLGSFATPEMLAKWELKRLLIATADPAVAQDVNDEVIDKVQGGLGCERGSVARYCEALADFKGAKALDPNTAAVWAGTRLVFAPATAPKVSDSMGEDVRYFRVSGQRASTGSVSPSNESEAKELGAIVEQMKVGRAPNPDSELMKYLRSSLPIESSAVARAGGSLSFSRLGGEFRVFVRENEREVLVVELYSDGSAVAVGIFPKR